MPTKTPSPEIISALNTEGLAGVEDLIKLLDGFIIYGLTGKSLNPADPHGTLARRFLHSPTYRKKKA